ncbi:hypothetical protein CYMTET_8742 [Cymbomonas tetramitiformis]|uniref:Uncharacterized protein n=1 Tax=Cymbomonas tetramitiformis TaxID=36881 RepID=A0AAE0GSE8_9CHLO|nr:hypothetical protein CYMTET_8742 [Cymbomonas tetramitiformis]
MLYAEQLQCAAEEGDSDRFDALCFLVGGEPEMCAEVSAYSFGVTAGGAPSALGKYAAYCQPVDTSMGGFHIGGASDDVPSFATVKVDGVHVDTTGPPPPPPLSYDGTDGDADDHVYPAADSVNFDNQTFADNIARGPLVFPQGELHLQNAWMIGDNDVDNGETLSDEEDDNEAVSDAPRSVVPRRALFCLCATAAPLAGQAFGGALKDPFGGMPGDTGADAVLAAITPQRQTRYRQEKQGFYRYRVVPLPPALQDPDPPVLDSPPYSPPSYTFDDEDETSADDFDIEDPSISPTSDVPAAPPLPFGCPMDMLRAGPTTPPPESG